MKTFRLLLYLLLPAFILTSVAVSTTSCSDEEGGEIEDIQFTNVRNGKITLDEGEDFVIKYIITPTDMQDVADITWETTDKSIARVRNGKVSAEGEGVATITAYAGNVSASVEVRVNPVEVTSFTLPNSINAYIDQRVKVEVTGIEPENGSISTIEWRVADEDIATAEVEDGVLYVTALKNGTTTLTGLAADFKESCSIVVKEYIPVKSIKVNLGNSTIEAKKTTTVSASITPSNASIKDVSWSFSPSSYVEFNEETNTIKGLKAGDVTVTATSVDGVSGEATLKIIPAQMNLSLEKSANDKSSTYMNIITPDGSISKFNKTIEFTLIDLNDEENDLSGATWKSSNTSVATVENGVVTAKGHGYTDISATINNTTVTTRVRSVKSSAFKLAVVRTSTDETTPSVATVQKTFNREYVDAAFINDNKLSRSLFLEEIGQIYTATSSNSNLSIYTNSMEPELLIVNALAPATGSISISAKYGTGATISVSMGIRSFTFIGYNSGTNYGTVQNGGSLTVTRYSNETIETYANVGSTYDEKSSALIYTDLWYELNWTSDNSSREHPFYRDYLFYTGTYNNLSMSDFGTFTCNLTFRHE